jgi:hypothetical protein
VIQPESKTQPLQVVAATTNNEIVKFIVSIAEAARRNRAAKEAEKPIHRRNS